MIKWIIYTCLLLFAVYWASNLILWYPWSYDPALGMTLMLTVSPLIWAYATYLGVRSYPGEKLIHGAAGIMIVFVFLAVIMDYIFFGLIRGAMEELYHPTTLYGYAFLMSLPFLMLLFKKRIVKNKKIVSSSDLLRTTVFGFLCFGILMLIVVFGIRESGFGSRQSGVGIWESEFGSRELGVGIWDLGFGI